MSVSARINGVEIQRCHTSDLVFDVATCISFISQTIMLDPGDVLLTGTGGDNTELKHGVVDMEGPELIRNRGQILEHVYNAASRLIRTPQPTSQKSQTRVDIVFTLALG